MAEYAARHRLGLRPHTKTHKATRVGREQVRLGAIGLTCATPREAEVMGTLARDILVAHPPVGLKAERLMRLDPAVDLMVALNSAEALETLARAAKPHGRPVRVLIELDLGMRRVGVPAVEEAIALGARLAGDRAPLRYSGVTFYPGHIRKQPGEERDAQVASLDAALQAALERLAGGGGSRPEVPVPGWHLARS